MNPIIKRILNPVAEDRKKPQRPASQWRNKWKSDKKLKFPYVRQRVGPGEFTSDATYPTAERAEQAAYEYVLSNATWFLAAQEDAKLVYMGPVPVEA